MPLPTNLTTRRAGVADIHSDAALGQTPPGSPASPATWTAARPPRAAQPFTALPPANSDGRQRSRQFAAAATANPAGTNGQVAPADQLFNQGLAQWASSGSLTERPNRRVAASLISRALQQSAPSLDLSGLELTSLPNNLENLHVLTSLTLADNMLHELPPLPASILYLDLSHNQFFENPVLPNNLQLLAYEGNGRPPSRRAHYIATLRYQSRVVSLPRPSSIGPAWRGQHGPVGVAIDRFGQVVAAARRNAATDGAAALPGATGSQPTHNMFNENDPPGFILDDSSLGYLSELDSSTPRASSPAGMAEIMMEWHPAGAVEDPEVAARWQQIAAEDNAPEFADFLLQLTGTADYKNALSRDAFVKSVGKVMTEVLNSNKYRETCFAIALDLTETCHDGVALGLNNMTLALIDHDAEAGHYSQAKLHDIGRNGFRLNLIDELTTKKIGELEKIYAATPIPENKVDPVEVQLAYQTGLAQEFQLKGVVSEMLYHFDSKLTLGDLKAAAEEIHRREAAGNDVAFLAEWSPWQKAIQRANPEAFQRFEANRDDERAWLASQPKGMKDGPYIVAFAEQKTHEKVSLALFTKRHTWQFREKSSQY